MTSEEDRFEEIEIDPEREAYYVDDPKKALKRFFDREGILHTLDRKFPLVVTNCLNTHAIFYQP